MYHYVRHDLGVPFIQNSEDPGATNSYEVCPCPATFLHTSFIQLFPPLNFHEHRYPPFQTWEYSVADTIVDDRRSGHEDLQEPQGRQRLLACDGVFERSSRQTESRCAEPENWACEAEVVRLGGFERILMWRNVTGSHHCITFMDLDLMP